MLFIHLRKVGAVVPTLFLLLSASTAQSQSRPGTTLADSLTAYVQRLAPTTKVSLATKSLQNGAVVFRYRANERVPSASVIKLPIMLEAMERVNAGTFDLNAIHTLATKEKVGGSGVLKTYPDQSQLSYRELMHLMMIRSDNTATNIFIHQLGRDAINRRMRATGLTKSGLNRVMMDTLAAKQGRENYVTADDMNVLLEKIHWHQVATPALCNEMITTLKQNADTLCMVRLLPKSVPVAHKTGELTYVRGDAGIIYAKEPFLLTVFVEGVSTPEAERIIGELALICYTYFSH